ncbi:hypothetical protein [Paenibacillus sp. 23TSA30-6]|uniref:hypothetical protein n=1 Tax=Paenibacillus sp. 23TSA30-6 TaxID=2546104 RepID=UPI001787DEA7|nr:hypothetical protein [Paenibacillus sp. 23TSA30-6]
MQTHRIEIKWDVKKENAEIYIQSVIQVLEIKPPIVIHVEAPSWKHTFTCQE